MSTGAVYESDFCLIDKGGYVEAFFSVKEYDLPFGFALVVAVISENCLQLQMILFLGGYVYETETWLLRTHCKIKWYGVGYQDWQSAGVKEKRKAHN